MNKNIVLCGVGGQGTVLASKLIASAAMDKSLPVMSAETIGMAQRGGSVFSHVRIGEDVYSPMIAKGEADIILGFEPGEAVRMLPFLKEGGTVIVSSREIIPVTATLTNFSYNGSEMLSYLHKHVKNLFVIDAQKACEDIGSSKVLNLLLLGAAIQSGALGLSEADIRDAIKKRLPEKFHELNFKALEYARSHSEQFKTLRKET
ncbi:indolepyruvate ferredoxin oxidoreductase, beta subunit [Lachnospiraceae bacterium MD308]|nr:indolepyruvate ferredoxin oxidoreductase, beta subunit [Lachnospiraceae bacterium MD308]MCI8502372.1 indolepyruvate oxidoreductase subunit beta [Dorea sp.]